MVNFVTNKEDIAFYSGDLVEPKEKRDFPEYRPEIGDHLKIDEIDPEDNLLDVRVSLFNSLSDRGMVARWMCSNDLINLTEMDGIDHKLQLLENVSVSFSQFL